MATPSPSTLLLATWAYLHLYQHGFHVSALNGLHEALTCGMSGGEVNREDGTARFHSCVPMTASEYGMVTSAFTIGGLFLSLSSDTITRKVGRVRTLQIATAFFALGSFCIGTANSVSRLILGRILAGGGAGLASVTVPLYLAELAPDLRGILSILAQLAVTSGVLTGQFISFPYAYPLIWRKAMLFPFGLSMLQLLGSSFAVGAGRRRMAEMSEKSLLDGDVKRAGDDDGMEPLRVMDIISSPDPRLTRGLLIVIVTQMSQQLCGITPVMSFSTRILTPVFKANSRYIATMMIIPKLPITLIPAFLLKRMSPRQLLCHSCYWTAGSALVLAIGLNTDTPLLSILGISVFVSAFSFGLGPVTVVVLSEVLPPHARTAAGSLGVALNWTTSFCMASIFLPLQQGLKTGPNSGDGNIFMLFSPICLLASVAITASYRALESRTKV